MSIWDVGGQDRLRDLWRHYYPGTMGIVFVVDAADHARMDLVKLELHSLMIEKELLWATRFVFFSFFLRSTNFFLVKSTNTRE